MVSEELYKRYLGSINEGRLYLEQGLTEEAFHILDEILDELRSSDLPDAEKQEVQSWIESAFEKLGGEVRERGDEEDSEAAAADSSEADQAVATEFFVAFEYGKTLMDSQFWAEAIAEFKKAIAAGERVMECWELCGDCATRLERWDEAIRYYEIVYTNPDVHEDHKRDILIKITKCSQTRKQNHAKSSTNRLSEAVPDGAQPKEDSTDFVAPLINSINESPVNQLLGQCVHSWKTNHGDYLTRTPQTYRVLNLAHFGTTSTIVELEVQETGERLAGQVLMAPYGRLLSSNSLSNWAYAHIMTDSPHLVKVFDLAHSGDQFIIVREHLPLSLSELLSGGKTLPIPLAISFAYYLLDGLGDLHLHMGRDEQIRRMYHLDLRPSRILIDRAKSEIKICNGGLWREIETSCPKETALQRLPLPVLAYRAPEQFRPYLSRRKPPAFTDIYLFGVVFYEMLTGSPPFRASSFEEYEIQHCDQYPTPPKVWRPEIPEALNNVIMKCLEYDPIKRWRSVTQISLILEKVYSHCVHAARNGSLASFCDS